jgi:glycosyltransferase involved in cell wall biosynthesis
LQVQAKDKHVFIFLDSMPQRQGSGASLRYYSNVQAYLDLGFQVEVIQVATSEDGSEPSPDLNPVVWSRAIHAAPPPSILGRVLFRAGIPHKASVAYYFVKHHSVRHEAELRSKKFPNAIFHFEGESIANAIPALPKNLRCIWSLHDLPSTVAAATIKIACEAQDRAVSVPERRELRFARRVERYMARHTPMILCIAQHDSDCLRTEWGCGQADYLPMSIPGDGADRVAGWLEDGYLHLLHLGRISHLPSFRSLEFLFEKIFTSLPSQVLDHMRLNIVGRVDETDDRARRILRLAAPFSNVAFHGFVEDVVPYYENSDVQIVASTDASGLRTRTIESFAYGLPVISTTIGARGIGGLEPGKHLLIADEPADFARELTKLADSPDTLARLSQSGREFYLKNQSRAAVRAALAASLQQHFGIEFVTCPGRDDAL